MAQFSPIVTCYEEILVLSGRMFEAAQAADWDADHRAAACRYLALVDRLRQFDHEAPFSDAERMRRYQLLDRILTCDARIRDLAMPPAPAHRRPADQFAPPFRPERRLRRDGVIP
ncbi:flagellar protein FliT [Cupriavidus basilensis]